MDLITSGTVPEILERAARSWPSEPALVDRSRTVSFGQLVDEVAQVASSMATHGVGPGDRVAIVLENSVDAAISAFGAMWLGAVAVPLSPSTGLGQMRQILKDAAPTIVVNRPIAPDRQSAPPSEAAPSDLAIIFYTSGSTADPKGVACPHSSVVFAANAIQQRLSYRKDDVVFSALPLAFDYGFYQVLFALIRGSKTFLHPAEDIAGVLGRVRDTKATVMPIVPGQARRLTALARRAGVAPNHVRLFTNTGDVLTAQDRRDLRTQFPTAEITLMFGLTECKRVTIADPDEDYLKPDGLGRPLPGTTIRIEDENGREVPAGVVGELVVEGPHVMAGYWNASELTDERFHFSGLRRVLRTGDFGFLDADGTFFHAGRRDGIFKLRGLRVSCHEIEMAARRVQGVAAAVVVPSSGDAPTVLAVVATHSARHVARELSGIIGAAKVPERCVNLDALPTTSNGKVDRRRVREMIDDAG